MFSQRIPDAWVNRRITVKKARAMIEELDPEKDCAEITHISLEVITPPLFAHMAYASGFARGTTHPAEAKAVYRGGGYLNAPVARDQDTMTFFGLLHRYGTHSEETQVIADRIQRIHHDVRGVGNNLQLHILGLMMYEPERWARDIGFDHFFSERENEARFHFWAHIGNCMGLKGIWESYDEVEPWILSFESKHQAPCVEGVKIYRGQIEGFKEYFPAPLKGLAGPVLSAGLPSDAREILDAPRVPWIIAKTISAVVTIARAIDPLRPVNLSSTWVKDFSRVGDDPNIEDIGYQHDTRSGSRYSKNDARDGGYGPTGAEGLRASRGCPMHGINR